MADVVLPDLISDHMVLQRSGAARLWGSAEPGECITVSLASGSASTVADPQGSWSVTLDVEDIPPGPHILTVGGCNTIEVSDVLIGDVWVASGQSNMEWTLKESTGGNVEAALPENPLIRHFKVERAFSRDPAESVKGEWKVASPDTSGDFSAVAYYFAKEVAGATGRPVGIVNATWGGTRIEGWLPEEVYDSFAGGPAERLALWDRHEGFERLQKEFAVSLERWIDAHGGADTGGAPDAPPPFGGDPPTVDLPGRVEGEGLPAAGIVWLRKKVALPANGGPVILQVPVDGFDSVYLDGRLLGSTTWNDHPGAGNTRRFTIPADRIQGDDHEIAIRLHQPARPAHFHKPPVIRNLVATVTLDGPWEVLVEQVFREPGEDALQSLPAMPQQPVAGRWLPSGLHNGMVAPLYRHGIRGVLWYQGESNSGTSTRPYDGMFRGLITSWRRGWGLGDLPFFFCQLAAHKAKTDNPSAESGWANVREAQSSVLDLPATGQAVLLDVGEAGDVHPRDKETPGKRLALLALAGVHERDVACSGPVPASFTVEGGRVSIGFRGTHGSLVARPLETTHVLSSASGQSAPLVRNSPGSVLEGFALRGADGIWHWASAAIENDTVVVWSEEVRNPVEVRYAWADNPTANLFNGAGLPASPFRSHLGD